MIKRNNSSYESLTPLEESANNNESYETYESLTPLDLKAWPREGEENFFIEA